MTGMHYLGHSIHERLKGETNCSLLGLSLYPPSSFKSMHVTSLHPSLNKMSSTVRSCLFLSVVYLPQ